MDCPVPTSTISKLFAELNKFNFKQEVIEKHKVKKGLEEDINHCNISALDGA